MDGYFKKENKTQLRTTCQKKFECVIKIFILRFCLKFHFEWNSRRCISIHRPIFVVDFHILRWINTNWWNWEFLQKEKIINIFLLWAKKTKHFEPLFAIQYSWDDRQAWEFRWYRLMKPMSRYQRNKLLSERNVLRYQLR